MGAFVRGGGVVERTQREVIGLLVVHLLPVVEGLEVDCANFLLGSETLFEVLVNIEVLLSVLLTICIDIFL